MDENYVGFPMEKDDEYPWHLKPRGKCCPYAILDYNHDPRLVYCAKYMKIMDGGIVTLYCHGNGGCDR